MTIEKLRDKLTELVDSGHGDHRVYVYSDNPYAMEAEIGAIEAQSIEPFKPFWSTVEGYIIQ
jgi:hypothetical protein